MKKYGTYKDSGIEWLGQIPKHWEVKKLKFFANVVLGKMLTNDDKGDYQLKPYLRAKNIEWNTPYMDDVKEMWFSENELRQYRIKKDDLLVSEGGEVGRTCIWADELDECYIQNSVHKVSFLNGINPKFFLNQFILFGKRGHFDAIVNRISIAHLTKEKVKEISFIYPPIEEQQQLAYYLDFKTNQIETLISNKEKLIELLKEERTAIINQAVTKGINPNVPMKDSEIEWLGEIPRHWEIKKLKYLCSLIGEKVKEKPEYVIALENIESWTGKVTGQGDIENMEGDVNLFKSGDVLFNKLRPYLAKVVLAKQSGGCAGELLVLRSNEKMLPEFLFYRMISEMVITIVDGSTYGTKMPRASWEKFISQLQFPFPKKEEQKLIVDYIESEQYRIDTIITKSEQEIELLKEYKTALISEVVTGKVDVRDEVTA